LSQVPRNFWVCAKCFVPAFTRRATSSSREVERNWYESRKRNSLISNCGFELEVAIVAKGKEEFARYVVMVPHLVVIVGKRLFTIATYRRGFELCLLFGREWKHFYIVRHNPVYNVHVVEYVFVEDLHHVVGSAVHFRWGLILGIRRDAVAAQSADLMFVDRAYAAATRADVVVLLVVGGIRRDEKRFEIAD